MNGTQAQAGPVAIVGAGTIGAGWAAFFALCGLQVRVADPSPNAPALVAATLERARPVMAALGRLSETPTVPRVFTDVVSAVEGAAHIQEALPEDMALKRRVYAQIEAAAPREAILASSSSGLLPTALQESMQHPERMLVVHPNNPPYLMPLVEIVAGGMTDPLIVELTKSFYESLGKRTIVLRREVKGHVFNRLQAALWREAVHLVAEGYASVEDVDRAVVEGLGARWAVCGPHEIFHLSGGDQGMAGFLDRLGEAVEGWWGDLGNPTLDAPTRKALVDGMAQAARNRSYAELAARRDREMIPLLKMLDNARQR
jgi:carnitine 3-dehydrogenase